MHTFITILCECNQPENKAIQKECPPPAHKDFTKANNKLLVLPKAQSGNYIPDLRFRNLIKTVSDIRGYNNV